MRVIEPAKTEWAAQILFRPKKDGALPFRVVYTKHNSVISRHSYPLPRMDERIDSLGYAPAFWTLNRTSKFWQIEVDEEYLDKTEITWHHGLFCLTCIPSGPKIVSVPFQPVMDVERATGKKQFTLGYLDNTIIFSEPSLGHVKHVSQVL